MKHDWEYKQIMDVGKVVTGSTPSTSDKQNYTSNDVCFVKPSDIGQDGITEIQETEYHISEYAYNNTNRKLPRGSVLVTCIGIIGKVGILSKEATCNQQINAVIPNNTIMPRYLAYSLYSIRKALQDKANAPVVPILNKGQFSSFQIPVPPLSVQEHICSLLDKMNRVIEAKKEQLKELDNLAQAMFYEMFGDVIINDRGWGVRKWNDCLTIFNGRNQKQVENVNGQYPICGSGGVMGRANQYITPENSVIVGRKGNINKPILMREKFWNVDTAFGIHPNGKELLVDYLYYFCVLFDFEQLNKAVTIPSLTKTDLLGLDMPVPPLPLQQSFAEKVEAIERQKELINQSIKDVQTLFDAKMDYFFGE